MVDIEKIKCNKNLGNDIKSYFNLNELFSFLDYRRKLNLIIYNNKLQKILGVNIHDYKKLSGKYKIVEKNGKGEEFSISTNKKIFEGEYLNKKRNSKGKEFYND